MFGTMFKWVWRLGVLTLLAFVVSRLLESDMDSGHLGDQVLPTIGGDTWPPVPVNASRPI